MHEAGPLPRFQLDEKRGQRNYPGVEAFEFYRAPKIFDEGRSSASRRKSVPENLIDALVTPRCAMKVI